MWPLFCTCSVYVSGQTSIVVSFATTALTAAWIDENAFAGQSLSVSEAPPRSTYKVFPDGGSAGSGFVRDPATPTESTPTPGSVGSVSPNVGLGAISCVTVACAADKSTVV